MTVKLFFGHAENGSSTAKMAIDDKQVVDFDYVGLVKHLFDNPNDKVVAEIEDSYNEEQKARLNELVTKIEETAKGRVAETEEQASPEQSCD